MATCDRRQFVPDAVACFLAQTLTDSELLVVDDGEESVADLLPESDRIRYIRLAPKHHFCELRDVALALARGRYVAVWDDDDLSAPERLAVQVAALERANAGLCLLGSSVVTRGDCQWVYTPATNPWALDNSAVFRAPEGFSFQVDQSACSAIYALKAAFADNYTVVTGQPDLLTTRMHGNNTCSRPCGVGPDWRQTNG